MKKVKSFTQMKPGKVYKILFRGGFDSYLMLLSKKELIHSFEYTCLCTFKKSKELAIRRYGDFLFESQVFSCQEME